MRWLSSNIADASNIICLRLRNSKRTVFSLQFIGSFTMIVFLKGKHESTHGQGHFVNTDENN